MTNPSPTSCQNEYYENVMGQAPKGFEPSPAVGKFGNPSSLDDPGVTNGVDFWWDEFPTEGNCWHDNVGPDGTRGSLTADPPMGTTPNVNTLGALPEVCDASDPTYRAGIGTSDVVKEAMLVLCAEGRPECEWFVPPAEPGTAAAAAQQREAEAFAEQVLASGIGIQLRKTFRLMSTVAERR